MVALQTVHALLLTATTSLPPTHHLSPKRSLHRNFPPCSLPLTCPVDSGCVAQPAKDNDFVVTCDMDFYGGDLYLTQTATLEECLVTCSITNLCIGVSYKGDNCYLKREIASHEDGYGLRPPYVYTDVCPPDQVEWYCHNAGYPWDEKYPHDNAGCYSAAAPEERKYMVRCARGIYGDDYKMVAADNLAHCIEQCQQAGVGGPWGVPNCVAVSFTIADRDRQPGFCYLKKTVGQSQFKLDEIAAILMEGGKELV